VPFANATHWVVHEQPQRVMAEIADFLQSPATTPKTARPTQ
jgi:pimeloyl-ACP methyl ester carboxylesterase